jgi:DNA polymerase-3 subunit epsilon
MGCSPIISFDFQLFKLRHRNGKRLQDTTQPGGSGPGRCLGNLLEKVPAEGILCPPDGTIGLAYQLGHQLQVAHGGEEMAQLPEGAIDIHLFQISLGHKDQRRRRRKKNEVMAFIVFFESGMLRGKESGAWERGRTVEGFSRKGSQGMQRSGLGKSRGIFMTRTDVPAGDFVAIDFETADSGPDSACAVALVRVEAGRIAARAFRLIRPPRRVFRFTHIHGIRWEDVRREPTFGEVWPDLEPMLSGASFLAAHNAPFDRGVLSTCCRSHGLAPPPLPFVCTVQLARRVWRLRPANLPAVCRHLGIPLRHHDAASDAEACARIVLRARAAQG